MVTTLLNVKETIVLQATLLISSEYTSRGVLRNVLTAFIEWYLLILFVIYSMVFTYLIIHSFDDIYLLYQSLIVRC